MKITLRAARINANLSQSEAAEKLGVRRETISDWEKGKRFPNAVKIGEIEKVYGIGYNDIIFLP